MKRIIVVLLFIGITACTSGSPTKNEVDTHAVAVKEMLVSMGMPEVVRKVLADSEDQTITKDPEKKEYFQCLFKQFNEDVFMDTAVPIYGKYYTEAEARKVTEVMGSPLGQKLKKVILSPVTKEAPPKLTPDEMREFESYSQLFDSATIDMINNELKEESRKLGMELAKPCVKYLRASKADN